MTNEENPMTVDGLYKEGFFKAIVLNGKSTKNIEKKKQQNVYFY